MKKLLNGRKKTKKTTGRQWDVDSIISMNLFGWFRPTPGTGALPDDRPESARQKDYMLTETVVSANPVNWTEKPEGSWRKFPDQDQNGSGSCVAQTLKKVLGVSYSLKQGTFVRFSASHLYQRRSNKPAGGMIGVEAFDIAMKGVTLEELAPSELLTDAQMDAEKVEPHEEEVGRVFAIGGHVGLPIKDIDSVASVIQTTGKAVMVWFYFTASEWSRKVPVIETALTDERDARSLRHSVTAVDFTVYNGKKALIIEDSAHFGGITRRVITEDFFKVRNFFARYPMSFKFEDPSNNDPSLKPHHVFNQTITFIPLNPSGAISDIEKHNGQKVDVAALQDILKYEGLMPTNIDSSGYYGAITAKSVLQFQKKHQVESDDVLDPLAGKIVGPKTLAVLNNLYGK